MAKLTYQDNFRVMVNVDYNQFYKTLERQREDQQANAQDLVDQIKRHCDGWSHVYVMWDTEKECEHCGNQWTEHDDQYNGGCCDADVKAMTVEA